MKLKNLTISGRVLEMLESRCDGDPVFFFHGNSSDAHAFERVFEAMKNSSYRLIAVSLPGHGGSLRDATKAYYSIVGISRFIEDVVQEYGATQYWIVGASLGGHAAMAAGPRLKGLKGLVTIGAPPISPSLLSEAFSPDPTDGLLFQAHLNAEEILRFASAFSESETTVETLSRSIKRTDPNFRSSLLTSIKAGIIEDETACFRNAKFPIALFAGENDRFIERSYYARFDGAMQLWGGAPVIFDSVGHLPHVDAPHKLASHLHKFLCATV